MLVLLAHAIHLQHATVGVLQHSQRQVPRKSISFWLLTCCSGLLDLDFDVVTHRQEATVSHFNRDFVSPLQSVAKSQCVLQFENVFKSTLFVGDKKHELYDMHICLAGIRLHC